MNDSFSRTAQLIQYQKSPFWISSELRTMDAVATTGAIWRAKLQLNFHHQQTNTQCLQAKCLSCRPI